jgi:hypothetical protein
MTLSRRYPGYDVLAKRDSPSWDDTTRRVVEDRLRPPAPRFLDARAFATLEAICDTAVPQPDRAEPIPVARMVDAAIAEGRTTGTRWHPLPPMQEAWIRALALIDAEAQAARDRAFAALPTEDRAALLKDIDRGETRAAWDLPPQAILRKVVLDEIVRAYYAHPAAWSEIGFGGPASPRGYVRLAAGRQDPWEAPPGRR